MNIEEGPGGSFSMQTPLDRMTARVLADVSLQEKLRVPDNADQFIALVVETAHEYGFDVSANDVRAAMQIRLPGMEGLVYNEVCETPLPPAGWLPIQASWRRGQLYLGWSYFGPRPLREPFFEGDVQRALFKPFNRLFRYVTPITKLPEWLQAHACLPPKGFIFHMSRCGSTLVAQMLAALGDSVVISEASPIDAVVRARQVRPELSHDEHARWLTWLVSAFGQPRGRAERHCFIKLDCWHTLALPLFRKAFPTVPWVFLYRDPVEVLVSQLRMPGMQMIPGAGGPDVFGLECSYASHNREDYCARVLAKICAPIAEEYSKGAGLLVNYRQLPEALWQAIMPHFGVESSDHGRVVMANTARYDAKTPGLEFTPDIAPKQQEAAATTRSVAEEQLGDIYRRLEALRLGT